MCCSDCKCAPSESGPSAAISLSLPKRSGTSKSGESAPLWSTSSPSYGATTGSSTGADAAENTGGLASSSSSVRNAKCDQPVDALRGGVCCRDLKGSDDERTLVDPDVVRDVIIGLSDGLTVSAPHPFPY